MPSLWPINTANYLPFRFHNFIVESSLPDTIFSPDSEKATQLIFKLWALIENSIFSNEYSDKYDELDPVMINDEIGENAQQRTLDFS